MNVVLSSRRHYIHHIDLHPQPKYNCLYASTININVAITILINEHKSDQHIPLKQITMMIVRLNGNCPLCEIAGGEYGQRLLGWE